MRNIYKCSVCHKLDDDHAFKACEGGEWLFSHAVNNTENTVDDLKCPNCGSEDYKVRPITPKPANNFFDGFSSYCVECEYEEVS